jgi:hypothetical protein
MNTADAYFVAFLLLLSLLFDIHYLYSEIVKKQPSIIVLVTGVILSVVVTVVTIDILRSIFKKKGRKQSRRGS